MLRLATFNLYQFCEPGKFWYERNPQRNTHAEDKWEAKKNWIIGRLEEMKADIVGFQEVFASGELGELASAAGYEHFKTVDTPGTSEDDPDVYVSSVVGLASKYPVVNIEAVKPDEETRGALPVGENFDFSRTPLRAVIDVPGTGHVVVYVAHLKSKHPLTKEITFNNDTEWRERVRLTMQAVSSGHAGSLARRSAEAACLYKRVTQDIAIDKSVPVFVLGDLNDDEDSIVLEAITMQGRISEIGGIRKEDWPDGVSSMMYENRMSDSFHLGANNSGARRTPTHFHRGEPGILDYILVSNALVEKAPYNRGRVIEHKVFNEHLLSDGVNNINQSDHGQVAVSVLFRDVDEPYRFPGVDASGNTEAEVVPEPAVIGVTEPEISNREEFIEAAGGVYESHESYRSWKGHDKYNNFWAFFFDEKYGWVKSAYGAIPVSTLYQKKRHSIEHIIPGSFLREYLRTEGRSDRVRRGATVNPFNFIAAERDLNTARSSFPFDMEDDKVKRPYKIPLNPEAYRTTGLDTENEWIIPSRSRGDMARAILYMVLVYEIDELYNEHIDWLSHWARVDAPAAWEIAYNEWVDTRLNIRNPFITTPQKLQKLLSNEQLMRGVVLPRRLIR